MTDAVQGFINSQGINSTLLAVVAFFLIRLVKQLDTIEKTAKENLKEFVKDFGAKLDKINETVAGLSKSLERVSLTIEIIEKESASRHADIQDRFKEQRREIILGRKRMHWAANCFQAIILMASLHKWDLKFKEMPEGLDEKEEAELLS